MAKRTTYADARQRLALLAVSCRPTGDGEYRVTFRAPVGASRATLGRLEDFAAYCPDAEEALFTGAAMAAHRALHPAYYAGLDLPEPTIDPAAAHAALAAFAPGAR